MRLVKKLLAKKLCLTTKNEIKTRFSFVIFRFISYFFNIQSFIASNAELCVRDFILVYIFVVHVFEKML